MHTEPLSPECCAVGLSDVNKDKNRFSTLGLLSPDDDRPTLTRDRTAMNYINAVFLDSYTQQRAFIVTQTPLMNTVEDFLALVYEYNVR